MNGILVVNKEKDYTSRDVVNIVGSILNTKKIGHTGTLDPLATGVLVLPVGKALKVSELLVATYKQYAARVIIGYETDTLDVTGHKLHEKKIKVSKDEVLEVLKKFVGKNLQQVPKYSAIKVHGRKLYEYARSGTEVELPVREIEIKSIKLTSDITEVDGYTEFDINCLVSKGAYIRSLIRDIGYALGSYGTMKELKRLKQGCFNIDMAYTINDIRTGHYQLLRIKDVLNIPMIKVSGKKEKMIKNGMVMDIFFDSEMALIIDSNDVEIAIYKKSGDKAKVFKMLI